MVNKKDFMAFSFRRVVLILLILPIFLTSCKDNEPLESGFTIDGLYDPQVPFIAYYSDARKFDIDNVELTFYFGFDLIDGVEYKDYPYFDIYFSNKFENKVFVKRIEEKFYSQKYSCSFDFSAVPTKIIFNASEKFKIPSELFSAEKGTITFSLHSSPEYEYANEHQCFGATHIYYERSGNRVVLAESKSYFD